MINKYPKYLFFIILISVTLKIFYFEYLSTITVDDLTYIKLTNNLFENFYYSLNNIDPHTFYPPLYPIILGLEKKILSDWYYVYFFNNILLTTITSYILCLIVYEFFENYFDKFVYPLFFLYPIFITGRSIINVSSEIIVNFILIISYYYILKSFKNKKIKYLILPNILLSSSYLIRPECILFFISLIIYQIIFISNLKRKIIITLFSLINGIIFILSYIYYLYLILGTITLSEKSSVVSEIGNNLSQSSFLLKINNLFSILFLTPNLINPFLLLGLIIFILKIFNLKKNILFKHNYFIIYFPTFCFLLILTFKYALIGRVIYQIIPFLLILSCIGFGYFIKIHKSLLNTFTLVFFIFSIFLIINLEIYNNHSVLYKKMYNYVEENFEETDYNCILSRDAKAEYYLPASKIIIFDINNYQNNLCVPKFIFVSNLTHIALRPITKLETSFFNKEVITINENQYNKHSTINRDKYFVDLYIKN